METLRKRGELVARLGSAGDPGLDELAADEVVPHLFGGQAFGIKHGSGGSVTLVAVRFGCGIWSRCLGAVGGRVAERSGGPLRPRPKKGLGFSFHRSDLWAVNPQGGSEPGRDASLR